MVQTLLEGTKQALSKSKLTLTGSMKASVFRNLLDSNAALSIHRAE